MVITLCGSKSTYLTKMCYWEDILVKSNITCLLPTMCYAINSSNNSMVNNENAALIKESQYRKIEMSDAILVIMDKDEQINIPTVEEILYAHSLHKRIFFTKNNQESNNMLELRKEGWNDQLLDRVKTLYEFKILNAINREKINTKISSSK